MRRVLITGVYGLIGNLVYTRLSSRPQDYETYGMARRRQPSEHVGRAAVHEIPVEKLRLADLGDYDTVRQAVAGMDTVVHLAAEAHPEASWERVHGSNIVGAYHVFEACRAAGVKRIVYASSNQVVFGYRHDEPYRSFLEAPPERRGALAPPRLRHDQPVRPMNLYACSKVFGEALAHMYAFAHGMSCICLRIGWVTADDRVSRGYLWCSRRDIVQLIERSIEAPPELRYDVFFGHSDNAVNLVDIEHAREVLGYVPLDGKEAAE